VACKAAERKMGLDGVGVNTVVWVYTGKEVDPAYED
jgi:hypothetical protein